MEPSRGECQALRARPERKVCNSQIHLLHLPQHLSHLEARKTDNDNAKQKKRKIEDNSNCSQPLACAQASHPVFKQAGERPALRSPGCHRCPRSNKRHFFIAQSRGWLRPIHFLCQVMAEISRHALTDLSNRLAEALRCSSLCDMATPCQDLASKNGMILKKIQFQL